MQVFMSKIKYGCYTEYKWCAPYLDGDTLLIEYQKRFFSLRSCSYHAEINTTIKQVIETAKQFEGKVLEFCWMDLEDAPKYVRDIVSLANE